LIVNLVPARVAIVFDEWQFADALVVALGEADIHCVSFSNPLAAAEALQDAKTIEFLITRTDFPAGMQNGLSLALTAKMHRPDLKVLFLGPPSHKEHIADLLDGWLSLPVDPAEFTGVALETLSGPTLPG
jgi:DNA-binding NarL/FixJ family response regulator